MKLIVGLVWCLAAASPARAHEEKLPKHDRLTISSSAIRLQLELSIAAGKDAQGLKQLFDRNRNGQLEPREASALTNYLVRQTFNYVTLMVDGQHLPPKLGPVTADPIAAGPDRISVRVEMSAAVNHPHHVRFGDRLKDGQMKIPVEIVLDGVEPDKPLPPQPIIFAEHPLDLDLK